ncbi:NPCBM/NEW2 domain-containing protein [Jiangella asiatica]|nr:NPCBM/NEW2 domain-containing protein [Jiangella asiatica]
MWPRIIDASYVDLVVDGAGGGVSGDHADWASARRTMMALSLG